MTTDASCGEKGDWLYCHHIVAFLDLMGQKECFNGISGVPKTEDEKAKLKDALKRTIGFIDYYRNGFQNFFSGIQPSRGIPPGIPAEFHWEYLKMREMEINLQSVSDAVVAWSPILTSDEAKIVRAMNSVWGILMAAAGMSLLSLACQHPVRGGIDIDGGVTIDSDGIEIYGPALNSAYKLESKIACSPRILIGNGLLKFLVSVETDVSSSRYYTYAKEIARQCRALIVLDEDDQYPMLHFLGAASRELMLNTQVENKDCRRDVLSPAYKFVKDSTELFKADSILGPRYEHLLKYFERYVPEWEKRIMC